MKKRLLVLLIIISVVLVSFSFFIFIRYTPEKSDKEEINENSVLEVIDGDSFKLWNGGIVRLICVDAPEKGQKGYEEAKEFLSFLILNKEVKLEKDVSDKDEYGRLLRYVYVRNENISDHPKNPTNNQEGFFDVNDSDNKEIFVNKEIVQQGYGSVFIYGNDTSKCGEIVGE